MADGFGSQLLWSRIYGGELLCRDNGSGQGMSSLSELLQFLGYEKDEV